MAQDTFETALTRKQLRIFIPDTLKSNPCLGP